MADAPVSPVSLTSPVSPTSSASPVPLAIRRVTGAAAWAALTRQGFEVAVTPAMLEQNRLLYGEALSPQQAVERILAAVAQEGDAAIERYAALLDGLPQGGWVVPASALAAAHATLATGDPELLAAIRTAIARVRAFHLRQPVGGFLEHGAEGALGQLIRPLERVGLYAPAGSAPLPSSLIHTAVPAQVAGVEQLVVCTPPGRDGQLSLVMLAVAHELGIVEVYGLGGPVAIAAMAYGSQRLRRVDKIGGPGNLYTVLAMKAVYGRTGIVSLPGPTETLVLADESANPRFVAADLLAQAEHAQAEPVLVSTSGALLEAVERELAGQLAALPQPNQAWARQSLTERGLLCLAESLTEALAWANHYAPEHLCLLVAEPWACLGQVKHAGGVFVGEDSMEALGDYAAGPSHVMPTMGTARFSSPVNVRDFQRIISVVGLNAEALAAIGPAAARLARAEGLEAHARAIEARLLPD
jgi:histidinol dehydrogenase